MAPTFREAVTASFAEVDGRYVFEFKTPPGEGSPSDRFTLELEPMIGGGYDLALYAWQDEFFAELLLKEKVPILPFPSRHDGPPPESHLIQMMRAQVKAERRAEFESSEQLSLGGFIAALEGIPDLRQPIQFDFGAHPWEFMSYRGFYDELALGFFVDRGRTVFADFTLGRAKDAVDQEFEGYKGGEYQMDLDTPLWAANYGKTGSVAIVGVEDLPDRVGIVIHTRVLD